MRKAMAFILAAVFVSAIGCSKKSPEAQAVDLMNKTVSVFDDTTVKMKAVKDDKEAAAVLTGFAVEMSKLTAEAKQLEKDFPDFKEKSGKEYPEIQKKMEESIKNFSAAMIPVMVKYNGSKEIAKAMETVTQAMKGEK
ncbi:MAG TPA: hypothetical protein PKK43_05045 [Spirochaetota bacterium]|nr:hypothetical protein [Spirochaetota bacterium]